MARLFVEALENRNTDLNPVIPGKRYLRFDGADALVKPLFKKHFKLLIRPTDEMAVRPSIALKDAFDGEFVEDNPNFVTVEKEGEFIPSEGPLVDAVATGVYEVLEMDLDGVEGMEKLGDVGEEGDVEVEEKELPKTLGVTELTSDIKLEGAYPSAKSIVISSGEHVGNYVALEKITFAIPENGWGKNATNKDRLAWIVYVGYSAKQPIIYSGTNGGETFEVDFTQLPSGKYRIEALGKYSQWHANQKVNRFGDSISSSSGGYAILDIEVGENKLNPITSVSHIYANDSTSFSVNDIFQKPENKEGLTWTIQNQKGENVLAEQTQSQSSNSINIKFPKSGDDALQEYTILVKTSTGLTTTAKVQVAAIEPVDVNSIPLEAFVEKQNTPWVKAIACSNKKYVSREVPLKPVTFKVTDLKREENKDLIAWAVYDSHATDKLIMYSPNIGKEFTVDFSKLPEGKYRIEGIGRFGSWNLKTGKDRYGTTLTSSDLKTKMAILDVESKPNTLKSLSTNALQTNEASKKQETNWGVPVKFNANLLFDQEEDIAQLHWVLTDSENKPILEEETQSAEGKSVLVFNFPQPENPKEYKLTLTFNGISKTQVFTVVPQADIATITVSSSATKYLYNSEKELTFKVSGYSQKQANEADKASINWIRIFFPNLKERDYSEDIKLTFAGDSNDPVAAYLKGKTGLIVDRISGSDTFTVPAGKKGTNTANYQKGLYIVEAYAHDVKPDGKNSTKVQDTKHYELISNEPLQIVQIKTNEKGKEAELTGKGFMRSNGEKFKFKTKDWLFSDDISEKENVRWAVFKNEKDVLPLLYLSDKGEEIDLSHNQDGDYILKAWVDDISLAASIPVSVQTPKLLKAFYADSTGKRIDTCGVGDTVFIYMETEGLQHEEVQVNAFEIDNFTGHDLIAGLLTTPNAKGIIFQEFKITKEIKEKGEGAGVTADLLLTLSMDKDSPIILTNEYMQRTQKHYLLTQSTLLSVITEKTMNDVDFIDEAGRVLTKPKLYGEKVRVRVRLTNMIDSKVYITIKEFNTSTKTFSKMTLAESSHEVVVDKEGYAILEFTIPDAWKLQHKGKDTDVRYFYPSVKTTGGGLTFDTIVSQAGGKTLKVAKTMPSEEEINKLAWHKPEYGDVLVEKEVGENPLDNLVFPLLDKPLNAEGELYSDDSLLFGSSDSNWTKFGANRDGGSRKHGAIDMYTLASTNVFPITDGTVLFAGNFYLGTWEVTIEHDIEVVPGHKLIVRYGEMDPSSIKVKIGDRVKPTDILGKTGFLQKNGSPLITKKGATVYMLHLEMYSGELGNDLSKNGLTKRGNGKYERRDDLIDPEDLLIRMYNNKFPEKDGSQTYFSQENAKEGLQYVLDHYGRDYAVGIERIYRAETAHFESEQFLFCGTPGMEATKNGVAPYYGWSSKNFSAHPDSVIVDIIEFMEGKGLSDQGGIEQNTKEAKHFIKMKTVTGAMVVVAERIKNANGNFGAWYSNDVSFQDKYKTGLEEIVPRFVNQMK